MTVRLLIALTVSGLIASGANAATGPVVVELFTAQGCPACPLADILLEELARRSDLLTLGFHVDYWDGAGWKDNFSSGSATKRQKDYLRRMDRTELQTPLFVIGGIRQIAGSAREPILRAIDASAPPPVSVSFSDDNRSVLTGTGQGEGTVLLVRFVKRRSTMIAGGENARRKIVDVNGVKAFSMLGNWTGQSVRFAVPRPLQGEGIAVLIQASDGRILGAASLVEGEF